MGLSALFNLLVLRAMPKKQKSGSHVIFFVIDALLACFLMVMLSPTWHDLVSNNRAYTRTWALGYNRYQMVILGTYGTVTVLTNL
ncbi:hypothetical protein LTR09_010668 [Extremus antarcticus]|uniref:Uncharacterized protein n=1 Tax=Extremus antarcticus TaxID=702011 RepID=A0AAJ0DD92_9PEZI|nr:hypothetical protein LTR09_010668 [Extremus antarcticus]